MTAANTARRERAEKWVRERAQIEDRANWITVDTAYLAGAREEAAIKDAEIVNLKSDLRASGDECGDLRAYSTTQANEIAVLNRVIDDWHRTADDRAAEIIRQEAEIAALREERERMYTVEEVTAWLSEYHGKYREIPMTEWIRTRRALEEGNKNG